MKTIQLKSGRLGRYDDVSPFLVESGALELKIELPKQSGEFFLVSELNGKSLGTVPLLHGFTAILHPSEAGELKTEVKHYLHGELVETYKIEPLLLKAVDRSLSAMPEIAALTAECVALRSRSDELLTELKRHKEEAEREHNKLTSAFLSFAYAEYRNDVQLNARNLSAEEFAAALGYENYKTEDNLYEKI